MDHHPRAHSEAADAAAAAEVDDAAPAGERRSSLRQYQVQLLERMQAAKSGAATGVRELGVEIKGRHYLLDLTQIGEIVTQLQIAPVPLTRPWYLGLANIRGDLTGVIDLALYQGQAQRVAADGAGTGTGLAAERRMITFASKLGFNCALLADRVLGLRTSSQMRAVEVEIAVLDPADVAPTWGARHFDDADDCRWTLLDLAQLVREPRFALVGF